MHPTYRVGGLRNNNAAVLRMEAGREGMTRMVVFKRGAQGGDKCVGRASWNSEGCAVQGGAEGRNAATYTKRMAYGDGPVGQSKGLSKQRRAKRVGKRQPDGRMGL